MFFLLQSCSGGRIGTFLESSFKDNDNSNKITQDDINNELRSKITYEDKELTEKKDKSTKIKLNEKVNPQITDNFYNIATNDEYNIKKQTNNYKPKSYRIFVILKKVDPSFPTENFSKVLRNGNINFEIEKIELMPDLNQNNE